MKRVLYCVTDMLNFESALKLIEQNDVITIYGHAMPDGDCYGSQLGLRELIKDNFPGKKVYMVGTGLPAFFERLAPMDEVDEETIASSLAILVDVSCLRRVEDARVFKAKEFLKFDHHQLNNELEPFDGVAVVDSNRIAACEIIAEMALAYKWKISTLAAEAMFLGMCTDSGRFVYQGTTARTLEIRDFLKRKGIHTRSLLKIAYYESPERIRLKERIRRGAKYSGSVRYYFLAKPTYEKYGVSAQEALHLVNSLSSNCEENHSYALFVEFPDGQVNVELRSNKGYPVHGVAKAFGGGGHRFASGCTIPLGVEHMMAVIDMMNTVEKEDLEHVGA